MTLYTKADGVQKTVAQAYVRVNGVYVPAKQAYVRVAGVYQSSFIYDETPPNPPEITLQLVEHRNDKDVLTGRYIKVGVRLPGGAHDDEARLVRVLTNYQGGPPTTNEGGNFTQESDNTYPNEPWSEWRYNSYGTHDDTSQYAYKQWEPNSTSASDLENDKTYYFTGWSLDNRGNWSIPTAAQLHVPKASVDAHNIIVKETSFQPNASGSWKSAGYQSGQLEQANNPRSRGLWFYGSQFTNSIGTQGEPTIRSAQVWIKREDDGGQANADIHLFWTKYSTPGDLPAPGTGLTMYDTTKLGTLALGQSKWFDLPARFLIDMNKNIKGMGLDYKDYQKAGWYPQDYSVVQSVAQNLRCGEVHVVWQEKP